MENPAHTVARVPRITTPEITLLRPGAPGRSSCRITSDKRGPSKKEVDVGPKNCPRSLPPLRTSMTKEERPLLPLLRMSHFWAFQGRKNRGAGLFFFQKVLVQTLYYPLDSR